MVALTARLARAASEVRGVWSKKRNFSDPLYSSAVVPSSLTVRVDSPALDAGTEYYYTLEIDGVLQKRAIGRIKTPPPVGTPASFKFWAASCARTGSTHPIFDFILSKQPDLGVHMGDFHYRNIASTGMAGDAERMQAYDAVLSSRQQARLYASMPMLSMTDDHDFTGNNTGSTDPGRLSAKRAFRTRFPHPYVDPNPDGPIYYSYTWGRVVFIVTDLRSERSANTDTDNSSKTMMGSAQKAWFKNLLTDEANAGRLFCWVSTVPWNHEDPSRNDAWTGFQTERTELANFFKTNDLSRRLFIVQGDSHCSGIDDGTNTDFATGGGAPIVVGLFAPLNPMQVSAPQSTYEIGASGNRQGQFGLVHITDAGDDSIGVRLEVWRGVDDAGSAFEEAFYYEWVADISAE